MLILEPFAGIQVIMGHYFYHLAFFVGSFLASSLANRMTIDPARQDEISAFYLLRWVHFLSFILMCFIEFWDLFRSKKNTNAKSLSVDELTMRKTLSEFDRQQQKKEEKKKRITSTKIFEKIIHTITMFLYLGALFNAQAIV